MRPLFARFERLCRPRLDGLTRSAAAHAFTGAQLLVLGILLALPIPLTNYPFALLILAYAIAIIERGTPQELLEQNGVFAHTARMQSAEGEEEAE